MNKFFLPKKKKALSEIIAVVIIILLVFVTTGIVWNVVNNLIKNKTQGAQSCFNVGFDQKITFNNDYTCYNSTSKEMQFSVNIGDVDLDEITVSISAGGSSKSFVLNKSISTINGLVSYPGRNTSIAMPGKNSGLTYIASGIYQSPEWIKIAPTVEGKQCEVTDTISEIYDCNLFS